MLTPGALIGMFVFVVVILVVAYLIQRLDSAIGGETDSAATESTPPSVSDHNASEVNRSSKSRRHGRR